MESDVRGIATTFDVLPSIKRSRVRKVILELFRRKVEVSRILASLFCLEEVISVKWRHTDTPSHCHAPSGAHLKAAWGVAPQRG